MQRENPIERVIGTDAYRKLQSFYGGCVVYIRKGRASPAVHHLIRTRYRQLTDQGSSHGAAADACAEAWGLSRRQVERIVSLDSMS